MLTVLSAVNLFFAAACIGLGTVKALALRRQRDWTLALTSSVLILAGLIFLIATPAVYEMTGQLLGSPNIAGLLIPAITLTCVAHAHALTQLWQPDRRAPALLRRTAARWAPFYTGALTTMSALYATADLGPAAPLKLAATYAHVPQVRLLHVVYWIALITAVTVTVRECLNLSIPGLPELRQVLGWFVVAVSFDLLNVLITAAAMVGSITGSTPLEGLAQSAWLATIASCLSANVALAALVLRSRRTERRDLHTLQALHDLVVPPSDYDHDPHGPKVVLEPRWSLWPGFDTGADLNSLMAEIHDGAGRLSPWWHRLPSAAVQSLAYTIAEDQSDDEHEDNDLLGPDWNLTAAQAAAALLYAVQAREASAPPVPAAHRLAQLPGSDVPESADRQHLVSLATHLHHPVVTEAVALAQATQAAATAH
ncbi:hypothetical protein [Streptomyces sp. NPDC029554]|uniref:hypothetical protein n=1 Tax=Streptomyces sp. NPDC029554 TaxID=3155126 RepID=UPI0033DB6273